MDGDNIRWLSLGLTLGLLVDEAFILLQGEAIGEALWLTLGLTFLLILKLLLQLVLGVAKGETESDSFGLSLVLAESEVKEETLGS